MVSGDRDADDTVTLKAVLFPIGATAARGSTVGLSHGCWHHSQDNTHHRDIRFIILKDNSRSRLSDGF